MKIAIERGLPKENGLGVVVGWQIGAPARQRRNPVLGIKAFG